MKTLKTILIAALFVTVNLSVNAESMDKNKKTETATELKTTELFTVIEEDLSLENWMMYLKSWNTGREFVKTDKEETLKVENWMLDFNHENQNEVSQDEVLKLEDWMLKFS